MKIVALIKNSGQSHAYYNVVIKKHKVWSEAFWFTVHFLLFIYAKTCGQRTTIYVYS